MKIKMTAINKKLLFTVPYPNTRYSFIERRECKELIVTQLYQQPSMFKITAITPKPATNSLKQMVIF